MTIINGPVYEQIYNYFYEMTGSSTNSAALSNAVLEMTSNSGTDPLTVLQQLNEATSSNQLKQILISIFNSGLPSVANIGFSKSNIQNPWVSRQILP